MGTVLFVIGIMISGLVVGALARLLLPDRDPMSQRSDRGRIARPGAGTRPPSRI